MQQSKESYSSRMISEAAIPDRRAPTPVSTTVTCAELNSATWTPVSPNLADSNLCIERQDANSFSSAKVTRILTAFPYAAVACATDLLPAPVAKYPCCSYQRTARSS